jgi:hypothetical protein
MDLRDAETDLGGPCMDLRDAETDL